MEPRYNEAFYAVSCAKNRSCGFSRSTEIPGWAQKQRTIQKSSNLQEWLTTTVGARTREAEIIKKVLTDIFPQLS